MLYDKPEILGPASITPGSLLWDVFVYMTQLRLMEKVAGADFTANPSKDGRSRLVNSLFPQMEALEIHQKQRTIERIKEWTSSGPISVAPLASTGMSRPRVRDNPMMAGGAVPVMDVPKARR